MPLRVNPGVGTAKFRTTFADGFTDQLRQQMNSKSNEVIQGANKYAISRIIEEDQENEVNDYDDTAGVLGMKMRSNAVKLPPLNGKSKKVLENSGG